MGSSKPDGVQGLAVDTQPGLRLKEGSFIICFSSNLFPNDSKQKNSKHTQILRKIAITLSDFGVRINPRRLECVNYAA
jgi:hypothetical protein